MPVGRPVALRIIAENSTGFDQCRNGANVVTESSVICPPNGAVHGQLPNNVDHRFRRIVVERQVMAAGHNLPKRVYCYGSDMGGVDFHADERARIGDDAQSGLRTAATFRIFFLD